MDGMWEKRRPIAPPRQTLNGEGEKFRLTNRVASLLIDEIVLEDRHLELERAIVVLVVDEEHTDEFLADIDLGGIILLRPRHDADLGIAEYALQVRVELPDFLDVHGRSPIEIWLWRGFRTRRDEPPAGIRESSGDGRDRKNPVPLPVEPQSQSHRVDHLVHGA